MADFVTSPAAAVVGPPPPAPLVEPYTLSQSKIKRLRSDKYCPRRFILVDMEQRYQAEPTVSMLRGQLFEYLAFGSLNREYKRPELPRNLNKTMTAEEKRIIFQASEMKRVMPLYGMTLVDTCVPLTIEWQPGLLISMLLDAFIYWKREPDPRTGEERSGYYIYDAKLTGNVHSTFGEFCWGLPVNMNHLQAWIYMEGARRVLQREVGFVYGVFDYKTRPEHKMIEVKFGQNNRAEMRQQVREGLSRLEESIQAGWPAVPHFELCKTCPVPDCEKRNGVPPVFIIH